MVGLTVGPEGASVNDAELGVIEGLTLGAVDGTKLGNTLGTVLGTTLGKEVGTMVGAVGIALGDVDGRELLG